MYKLLLCQRYLRTRYIALASIISVTLGVATMIVVNSVMAGFGSEMRSRIQGILSDIIIETRSLNGEFDPDGQKELIRSLVGKYISGVTATVEVYGILSYQYGGNYVPHPVTLVGIDPASKSEVGPLTDYLQSYQPRKLGDQVIAAERNRDEPLSWELTPSAMAHRMELAKQRQELTRLREQIRIQRDPDANKPDPSNPFGEEENTAAKEGDEQLGELQRGRVYVGVGQATYQHQNPKTQQRETFEMIRPGDDVRLVTFSSGTPSPVYFSATVADTFKTGMSEYDSTLVFCNIEYLQEVRKMIRQRDNSAEMQAFAASRKELRQQHPSALDDGNEMRAFTSLQIKLKDYKDAPKVLEILRSRFSEDVYSVNTWEQKQGPLLAAVDVESSILNILLFLIITVAGFGILAIFYMIVVEKTRDIGILKALGASSSGIMSIFLTYGLLLGMVGAGAGVGVGLLFVYYINQVEALLAFVTGKEIFPEKIYYFKEIPTHVVPFTVIWVALGAIMIAVLASVLPARRASRLRPVQALRYE